jgi:hypothetical protein
LRWPAAKVQAAVNYAEAFPEEIDQTLTECSAVGFTPLKRILPQALEFTVKKTTKLNAEGAG